MLAPHIIEPITLSAGTVHRIEDGEGLRVTSIRGPVWITQEGDRRDTILAAGQSFVLDRPGLAVVFAFKGAVITVASPTAASEWQTPATAGVPARADQQRACA